MPWRVNSYNGRRGTRPSDDYAQLLRTLCIVLEDASIHPVRSYSITHRSLLLADEGERQDTASRLLEARAFEPWEYTRDEMAELLEALLAGGHIEPEMQEDARSLLLQWAS